MIGTLLVVWSAAWQYACQLRHSLQYLRPCTALCTITGGAYSGFAECRTASYVAGLCKRHAGSPIYSEHLWRDQKLLKIRDKLEKKIISLGGIFTVLSQLTDGLTCGRAADINLHITERANNAKEGFSSFAQTALNLYNIARIKVAEFIRKFSDDTLPPTGMAPSTTLWEENFLKQYHKQQKQNKTALPEGAVATENAELPTFMNGGCYA